jgi:LCP family protein required for cell wall assembly
VKRTVRRVRCRRILVATAATFAALMTGTGAIAAAWLNGARIPLVSGTPYLQVAKIASQGRADRVEGGLSRPFYVLLVGNDSRPGVGGARGDALHVLGVNPALHQASMLDIPRDTCWQGEKINVGNTHSPRTQANDVAGLLGINIAYVVDVDFAGFLGLVDGVGGVNVYVPTVMHDSYSGAYFSPGVHHMGGLQALAFSRDRHDFPQSDIIRTSNQGRLILEAMAQLDTKMQTAPGEFRLLALLGRHARLDGIGIKDLYHLGRIAFSLDPAHIQNITIPYSGASSCLTLGAGAGSLFADFRDDAVLESH